MEEQPLGVEECIEFDPNDTGQCDGPVEFRLALSGTGRRFPRCEKHWQDRLAWQEQHDAIYPDSPIPPAWFDPMAAGERWDED